MAVTKNSNGKRAIETIDLTGNDEWSFDPQPRKTSRPDPADGISQSQLSQSQRSQNQLSQSQRSQSQLSQSQLSQSQRDNGAGFDDEDDANDIIILSQDGNNAATESYELYGVLNTKIVGIQYYRGHATNGEFVIIRREPSNQYDHNAIRVDNVRREQIGHIPRQMAAKLARYMDAGTLLVEGSLAGQKGSYDCPIALRLFGTSDPIERASLKSRMQADRLPVDTLHQREEEEKRKRMEELKKFQAAKKAMMSSKYGSGRQQGVGSSQPGLVGGLSQSESIPVQSIEQIMQESQRFNPREMSEVVEKYGTGEDTLSQMPMADFPERLATKLLPYQRQALAWLIEKENPRLPAIGSNDVVQLWKRSPRDARMFTNIATNFSPGQEPSLASGGILADDMGLGKTLEMIALMVADTNALDSSNKITLIVAPVGVMSNWSGQIAHHVQPDSALKVFLYHGNSKKKLKTEEFGAYDVVITTYGTLSAEYIPRGGKEPAPIPREHGLFAMNWRRVILDEGHGIRNPHAKSTLAATSLLAQSRWVLTGTPIVNNLKDLFSLVRFLGLSGGLEGLEIFNAVLIRPLNAGDESAGLLLQALMATICLRRKKEMKFVDLRLPELTEYVHRIEFLPHEQEKYEALAAEAQGLLRNVQVGQRNGDGKVQEQYRNLLEILLRLRQVCNHWKLCGERVTSLLSALGSQKVVDLTPENRQALQDMLQLSIESRDECPICLSDLHDPVITACTHVFGYGCIERVIETQHRCPMCRAEPLEIDSLVRPAAGLGETSEQFPDIDEETSSSKVEALLSILKASHRKSGTKVVIFSQWTKFLDVIQRQLTEHNYTFARIDGTMRPPARDAAMTALESDPNCTIMLASLAVCSVGLNLVAANQVILADSWWAPAIEDQAVDRVHRLGQKRPTTVWRLVMEKSIEERVLEIQAEKRRLMMTAFQEKSGKRAAGGKTSRLGDIEHLLR